MNGIDLMGYFLVSTTLALNYTRGVINLKKNNINIHVVISSSSLIVVLLAWVVLAVTNPTAGNHLDQLNSLAQHWQRVQLLFVVALLIAPVFLYFMASLHQQLFSTVTMSKITGFTLAFFYFLAATLSYGAQLTLVPHYLQQNAIFMAELWYFFNSAAIAYFINQTGYALWALAVIILFWPLIKRAGMEKWLGILFMLSAGLSLAAYAGLLAEMPSLAPLTIASGGLVIPIAVLALIQAIRKLKMDAAPDEPETATVTQSSEGKLDHADDLHPDQHEVSTQQKDQASEAGDQGSVGSKAPEASSDTQESEAKRSIAIPRLFMVLLVAIMVIAGVLGGFIGVVSFMNPVPEAIELLEVYRPQDQKMPLNTPVTMLTFNIGYGGLDKDRDFFMDGGVESRSESLERTLENTQAMIEFMQGAASNIMLLQEVDIRSSRSFNVNQLDMIREAFPHHGSVHGWNYKALWVPVPVLRPMGYTDSGITTFSEYMIEDPVRYQLPGSEAWPRQLFDLDRCMVETRIPVENGNTLVLVNLHLSAYDQGGKVREHQLGFVKQYLIDQAAAGHYVIVGGDWNHLLSAHQMDDPVFMAKWPDWLMPLPDDFTPESYHWAVDPEVYTVRDNATPYTPGESFVTIIDGFIASDNVEILRVEGHDLGFTHSDHNPVSLVFALMP